MEDRKDPESTRCTFIIDSGESRLFHSSVPGDRIEIYEQRDGRPTGFYVTVRVLRVDRIPPRDLPPPAKPESGSPN
jgi:hypothetical protein